MEKGVCQARGSQNPLLKRNLGPSSGRGGEEKELGDLKQKSRGLPGRKGFPKKGETSGGAGIPSEKRVLVGGEDGNKKLC